MIGKSRLPNFFASAGTYITVVALGVAQVILINVAVITEGFCEIKIDLIAGIAVGGVKE